VLDELLWAHPVTRQRTDRQRSLRQRPGIFK
jgi:hypothetical protein